MIDYASIAPVMSLSTFIAGSIIVLLIGRTIVELSNRIEDKRKARGIGSSNPAGKRRQLSPSQKCIQRYYNRNQYENKGA